MNHTPPKPAAWLLQHLAPEQWDALEGDLREEFARREAGAAWYWRQVVATIVAGFLERLRVGWKCGAFAMVWTGATVIFAERIYRWLCTPWRDRPPLFILLPWPWSLAGEMAIDIIVYALPFAVGLAMCQMLRGRLSLPALAAGMAMGIPLLILGEVATTFARRFTGIEAVYAALFLIALLLGTGRRVRQSPQTNHPTL